MGATLTDIEVPRIIMVGETPHATELLLPADQIQERVAQLGGNLGDHYASRGNVHVLSVLFGALRFSSDLRSAMRRASPNLDITHGETRVSSYKGMSSTGELQFHGAPPSGLTGKHVLIVEDVLDSGLTLDGLVHHVEAQEPASLEVVVAVRKDNPERRANLLGETALHVGFEVGEDFIVGYGLDYEQQYRELDDIFRLTSLAAD